MKITLRVEREYEIEVEEWAFEYSLPETRSAVNRPHERGLNHD